MKLLLLLPVFLFITLVVVAQGRKSPVDSGERWVCEPCGNACDTIVYKHPGTCPICGMKLEKQSAAKRNAIAASQQGKLTVCFYLQPGVEVLDFAGPMEVFVDAGFRVFTVSGKKEPIYSQGVLRILPDYTLEDAPQADILAFFGGNVGPSTQDMGLISWVRSRKKDTRYFFSVCTGAFILAKAGLLDGLTATTFHSSIDELRVSYPATKVLSNVRFVDNGTIITTAGISAGIDGALHLVAKLLGDESAKEVATTMEYDKWVPRQGLILNGATTAGR
jgi:transcriptional regulator GlxA family with amidase domain